MARIGCHLPMLLRLTMLPRVPSTRPATHECPSPRKPIQADRCEADPQVHSVSRRGCPTNHRALWRMAKKKTEGDVRLSNRKKKIQKVRNIL